MGSESSAKAERLTVLNRQSRRRTIELAASIKATFEPVLLLHLYPRSSIDIYLQIFEVDGCESLVRSHLYFSSQG